MIFFMIMYNVEASCRFPITSNTVRCRDSSLLECLPAVQEVGVSNPGRDDALVEDREKSAQVLP